MEADPGRVVEMLAVETRKEYEPKAHKKNLIEHLPCARYYARHLMYISLVLTYKENTLTSP